MRAVLAVILVFSFTMLFSLQTTIPFHTSDQSIRVVDKSTHSLTIDYSVPEISLKEIDTTNTTFTQLTVDGYIGNNDVGKPELPYLGSLISVPIGADLRINFLKQQTSEISLHEMGFTQPIYPAQPSYSKSQDMSKVSFVYDTASYQKPDYQSDYTPFTTREVGYARGERVFEVVFTPIQYNPVENTLQIYTNLTVEIIFDHPDLAETEYQKARTWSVDFEPVFQSSLLNYEPPSTRDTLMRTPTKYVVICHPPFADAMQPFVDWKFQQGFDVYFVTTATTGTTTTSIKAFLQNLWDIATDENPAPSYVLFVGDTAQIPAFSQTAGSDPHVSDLSYVRLNGNDYLNEMYFGRFSANNLNELTPQIEKTLMYEKYTMPDPTYLKNSLLIAGVDSYSATQYCNSLINYLTTIYFREDSQTHNYNTPFSYLHPNSGSTANEASIRAQVSSGVGWANYTAHGDVQEWYDPQFNNSHISQLTNSGKYPILIGNACLTSAFQNSTCFAEAWLRAENKGGVVYIGGTDYTYWNEDWRWAAGNVNAPTNGAAIPYSPSQLGMYDRLFHTHDEESEGWNVSVGAMVYTGNAVVQATSSNLKAYYWEIYSIMGDPSLVPYLGLPAENNASYPTQILVGQEELTIEDAPPLARIAISYDGFIYGVTFADDNGDATLEIVPFTAPCEVDLVITGQNHEPLITTIEVVPNDSAYLTLSAVVNSQTSSNTVDYDTTVDLLITVRNVGAVDAEDVTFTLTTSANYIDIISGEFATSQVSGNSYYDITEPFTIYVSANAPDQAIVPFTLTATTEEQSWQMSFSLRVNAPSITQASMQLHNATGGAVGFLNPGDSGSINITFKNTGHLPSRTGILYVAPTNASIVLDNTQLDLPVLQLNETISYISPVHVDSNSPVGTSVPISFFIDAQGQQTITTVPLVIGQMIEGFETGDFSAFPWTTSPSRAWTVITQNPSSGTYCAQSALGVGDEQSSTLHIPWPTTTESTIQFDFKVSSENNYDFLKFYIGDTVMGQWSGTSVTTWRTVSYPVPASLTNSFKWEYEKDISQATGQDRAWVDNIIFPPAASSGGVTPPVALATIDDIDFGAVEVSTRVSTNFSIANLGGSALIGSITTPAHYSFNNSTRLNVSPYSVLECVVSFSADEPGTYQGVISITTNDPNQPLISIPVNAVVQPSADDDNTIIPTLTQLRSNYPNPFNPSTTIAFDVAKDTHVSIEVFNIKGQKVKEVVSGSYRAGRHSVVWNGDDAAGRAVGSGIYFYRMTAQGYTSVQKMLLMK